MSKPNVTTINAYPAVDIDGHSERSHSARLQVSPVRTGDLNAYGWTHYLGMTSGSMMGSLLLVSLDVMPLWPGELMPLLDCLILSLFDSLRVREW